MTQDFCICICTYRRPALLSALLYDLSRQTMLPSALIIVDGDPDSGEVLEALRAVEFQNKRLLYVPSNHANLAYQRYLGWRVASQADMEFLLYLDDDQRIEQPDAVEKVLLPLLNDDQVVGVTAYSQTDDSPEKFQNAPILLYQRRPPSPNVSCVIRWLGSKTPPGGLSPSGHRRFPERQEEYVSVDWLQGRVMAFRMSALSQDCFSTDLFALTHVHCGMGEDTFLSHRVASKGKMLLAFNATFLHPNDALPNAYPIQARRLGYAISYSRRLLNDNYRWPDPPRVSDRLALLRSYFGNIVLSWGNALLHPARHSFEYALGYTLGAIRGIFQPPSARRLTPDIDWWRDAEEALQHVVEIGKEK